MSRWWKSFVFVCVCKFGDQAVNGGKKNIEQEGHFQVSKEWIFFVSI